ncbi:hypothetical protein LIER_37512 [Lithospermum erythrorhizon]|uniref:MINDY deubiquitinase domain-containing protein n=1 Tax=Lithospermum erythrorhizon TaxID=34254 RepID=A0AAV3PN61_LITER
MLLYYLRSPIFFFQANQNSTLVEPKENLIILPEEHDLFFQSNQSSTHVETKENVIATSESYEHYPNCDMVQTESTSISEAGNMGMKPGDIHMLVSSLTPDTDSKPSGDLDKPQALASKTESCEPIYEGEDCILDSKTESCENQEPVYEGEVVLAEHVENMASLSDVMPRSEMTVKDTEVIENFLRSSASQLTVYGLFCLQDGMKERELCVFFRNNHFNTMFKFEGELYILVTDQGYINQPDLVWEKLIEVNGDTLYMTGNFKEFKVDDHFNSTWDEHNAVSSFSSWKYTELFKNNLHNEKVWILPDDVTSQIHGVYFLCQEYVGFKRCAGNPMLYEHIYVRARDHVLSDTDMSGLINRAKHVRSISVHVDNCWNCFPMLLTGSFMLALQDAQKRAFLEKIVFNGMSDLTEEHFYGVLPLLVNMRHLEITESYSTDRSRNIHGYDSMFLKKKCILVKS